jgi:hypothetical protein
VQVETSVRFLFRPIAVNYAIPGSVFAAHCNELAPEIDVPIAGAGICAGINHNGIAVVGIVYCCLDVIEIGWGIVIDGDYPCCTRNCQKQTD